MIKGKKTIKGKGCYHGFKQGGGKYLEYLFSIPPPAEAEEERKYLDMMNEQENEDNNKDGKKFHKVNFILLIISRERNI